jgi:hypothetical protein
VNTALRIITRPDPDCLTGKEKGLRIVLVLSAESEEELQMWQDILLAAKAEALQHAALASQFDWSLTFVCFPLFAVWVSRSSCQGAGQAVRFV